MNKSLVAVTLPLVLIGAAWSIRGTDMPTVPAPQDGAPVAVEADARSGQTFAIDAGHSSVLFRVTHLKAGPFWGRFNSVSGEFMIDDAKLADSFVKVTIPVESVDTNSAGRDKHLKNPDFFDAKEYPEMSFKSSKIEKRADGKYLVHGELTMRGKKKVVVAEAEHIGTTKLSDRFGLRSGYEVTLTIDRTDFGMNYMAEGGGLSSDVRIVLGVEGKLAQ